MASLLDQRKRIHAAPLDRRSLEMLVEVIHSIADLKKGLCPDHVMLDLAIRISKID